MVGNTMTFIRGLLLALIAGGLSFASLPALANMAPVKVITKVMGGIGGGCIAPDHPHQSIRLDSEEIIIRLKNNGYVVDAVFDFFNTGETATEWTGFPKWVASNRALDSTFTKFECSVNGELIKFNDERDLSWRKIFPVDLSARQKLNPTRTALERDRHWLVSQITFPAHAKTTIRLTYEASYSGSHYEASYIYGTGSLWKGNIGKAVFVVDSTELGGMTGRISTRFENGLEPVLFSKDVKPELREISLSTVRYEMSDFKPHPEAFFRIRINKDPVLGADYTRPMPPLRPFWPKPKPMPPPPLMPTRVKK